MTGQVWQWGRFVEYEIPLRIQAAKRSVREHAEGECPACPGDGEVCEVLRCSIRRLIRHSGLSGWYRAL